MFCTGDSFYNFRGLLYVICIYLYKYTNVALTRKINERKTITYQEDVSFKRNLLIGLILDSTSYKRFRTRQCC